MGYRGEIAVFMVALFALGFVAGFLVAELVHGGF